MIWLDRILYKIGLRMAGRSVSSEYMVRAQIK